MPTNSRCVVTFHGTTTHATSISLEIITAMHQILLTASCSDETTSWAT